MLDESEIHKLLDEIVALQTKKVLECAQQFFPNITSEDVLQPVDYPQLESNAPFRYQEGVLAGMHTVRCALLAYLAHS